MKSGQVPDDSPHIAIIGAGPIGLDAALAAHDAGMSFTLYEAADAVGAHVRDWGHVRFFSPWMHNLSERMRRHLSGAVVGLQDGHPTGAEYARAVLDPLAQVIANSDRGTLRTGTRLLAVSRRGLLKSDEIGTGQRDRQPFRLLLADLDGSESVEYADVVLDCTGTYGQANSLGDGGIPAPGERTLESRVVRRIPDLEREQEWADQRILLVGAGHSAQTAARAFADLGTSHPKTHVTWVLRDPTPAFEVFPDDPLPERSRLAEFANELCSAEHPTVHIRGGIVVDALAASEDGVRVTLRDLQGDSRDEQFDRVLSLTGYVGDASLYRQLQVHECYATSGPMNLAAALLGESSADCLEQDTHGVSTLMSPEPDFFLLGAKSYGRNSTFLLKVGFGQVDEVIAHLASRSPVVQH